MKTFLSVVTLCLTSLAGSAEAAYPERPVTIIVPFAAGSATDNIVRAMSVKLREKLNVPIIIDNRAGANGVIGTSRGAKSPPDGYTLTAVTGTTIAQNPWLLKEMGYEPLKDFQAVGKLGGFALALVVKKDSPFNTYDDLVKAISKGKSDISYATSYGMQTVCGELIGQDAKGDIIRVPYKSSPQSIVDLIGGTVTFVCADLATSLSSLNSGSIKALTILTPNGSKYLPEVIPIQRNHPEFPEMQSWVGIAAPLGMPDDIVSQLSEAVHSIALDPDFARSLSAVGFESAPLDAAQFRDYMRNEYLRWRALIEKSRIEPQ